LSAGTSNLQLPGCRVLLLLWEWSNVGSTNDLTRINLNLQF
jgi:hypothetical protein